MSGAPAQDYGDAAETYPDAIWPAQAQRALRGLIGAWHDARLAAIPAAPDRETPQDSAHHELLEFCRAPSHGPPR